MTDQNPDREPHDDSTLILFELRGFRRELAEVQLDVKDLKSSFMGSAEHAGVYERMRQVEAGQRSVAMRYGSFFGFIGAMLGGTIQWFMNGQHPK